MSTRPADHASDGLTWIEFRGTGDLYTHNNTPNEWGTIVLEPISRNLDNILVTPGELANLIAVGAVKQIGWS